MVRGKICFLIELHFSEVIVGFLEIVVEPGKILDILGTLGNALLHVLGHEDLDVLLDALHLALNHLGEEAIEAVEAANPDAPTEQRGGFHGEDGNPVLVIETEGGLDVGGALGVCQIEDLLEQAAHEVDGTELAALVVGHGNIFVVGELLVGKLLAHQRSDLHVDVGVDQAVELLQEHLHR